MTYSRTAAWLLAGISAIAIVPTAASAQAPADAQSPVDDGTIVVTAQRRTENAMTVPVAVSVLQSEALHDYQAAGGDTLLSLSGRVPSLYVESTTGRIFPRFYIRGLGNIDFYLGASQPVSIIQDDVVAEHVILKSNPAFDIAQVEVLKGPQGSLFGRNTTAGIVKFDSAQPSRTWQGQGSVSYSRYNTINAEGGVGGPLNKDGSLSFRLSGLYQHRDNWISNTYTGTSADGTVPGRDVMGRFDEKDARLQLLFKPNDALSLRLSGHIRDYSGTASIFYRNSIQIGSKAVPSNFDRSVVAYDEGQNNPQAYKTHGLSLKADYDFGGATLTSITAWEHANGYSRGDTDGGAAANFGGAGFGQSQGRLRGLDQWTQEVRLASPDTGRFKWQVGGIYFDARDDTEFDQRSFFLLGAAANPGNWVLLHDVNTSWGLFGQASYDISDRLTFTAGGRLTNDIKHTSLLKQSSVSPVSGDLNPRLSDTKPSWDASLLYRATDDLSLYARVARGFRGPTIQARSAVFGSSFSRAAGTLADSETNTSWEAGVKSAFFDNKLHFNLTGFYYTVENIQLNGNDGNGASVLFNGNKARGYGLEAELEARPVTNLRFNMGLSLLHTEIKDSNIFAQVGATGGAGSVPAETVPNPLRRIGNNYYAQIDGNPLPNAPTFNLNLGGRYDLPVGNDSRLFIGADFNMQGKMNYVLYRTLEYTSNGNFELGMKAGYAFKSYELAVFARNLTNEKNLIGAIDTANYRAGVYNDPRVIGVMLSGSFR